MTINIDTKTWQRYPANVSGGRFYSDVDRVPGASVLLFDDFNDGIDAGEWTSYGDSGSAVLSVQTDTAQTFNGSAGAVRGQYPVGNGDTNGIYLNKDMPANTSELYVRFRARMPSATKRGCKFLKVFGIGIPTNYANVTFAIEYGTGQFQKVSFGDGSGVQNDTTRTIKLDGTTEGAHRVAPTIVTSSEAFDFDDGWHLFEFYWKFNSGTTSGNEVPDGEVLIKIDGVTRLHATGFYNRHYSNAAIDKVGLFGYYTSAAAFELMYDNVEITTGAFGTSGNESWLFTDGFESAGFTHTENGIAWSGIPTNAAVSADNPRIGTYSTKFTFTGGASGTDANAQRNFDLGDLYGSATLEFDLYVPDGTEAWGGAAYTHRADSPNNNKLLRLWSNNGVNSGTNGYNSLEKVGLSLIAGTAGASDLILEWIPTGSGGTPGQQGAAVDDFIAAADRGKWMAIRVEIIAESANAAGDGRFRVYKNGLMVADRVLNNWQTAEMHAYQWGYLLGYANSGFAGTTYLFIDNVKINGVPQ